MLKNFSTYDFLLIVAIALYVIFANGFMSSLELGGGWDSTGGYVCLAFSALALVVLLLAGKKPQTAFFRMWIVWIIWMLFDLLLLGKTDGSMSAVFRTLFGPMSFLLFYTVALRSHNIEKISFFGFVVLFAFAAYQTIINLGNFVVTQFGEDFTVSNIIYWSLCTFPFLLLTQKKISQYFVVALMFIMIILTGKRSATLMIALFMVVFLFYSIKGKNKIRNISLIGIALVALYFIITHFFQDSYLGILGRIDNLQEDEGSMRGYLWGDVWRVVENSFSATDWIFGKGYDGVRRFTTHTNGHNDVLQMFFDFGIIGFVFYVLMLVYQIKRILWLRKNQSHYFLGYAAALIIFIVLGAVSNLVVFYSYFTYICAFEGMVEARLVQQKQLLNVLPHKY